MTVRVKLSLQMNPLHTLAGMSPTQKGMKFILGKLHTSFCLVFLFYSG